MIPRADAGPGRGAVRDHVHDEQTVAGRLELDTEAHEAALDLGVEVVELAVGEKRGVLVEPADGGCGHLHQHHRRLDAEQRVGGAGHPGGHRFGVRLRGHRPGGGEPRDLLAIERPAFGRRLGGVEGDEGLVVDRDVHGEPAPQREAAEVGGVDVV